MGMIVNQEFMTDYVINPMARKIAELMKQIEVLDEKLDKALSVYNTLMKAKNESEITISEPKIEIKLSEQPKLKIIKKK